MSSACVVFDPWLIICLLALYVQFAQNSYNCRDQIFDSGEHLLYVQIGNVYDTDASFMTQLKDELQSFAEVGNTFKVNSGWDLLMTITFKL